METLADLQRHFVTLRGLASRIDCANLSPDATEGDIRRLCAQAKHYGFTTLHFL
jgi:deoxyribose-phosphate aldolase